MRHSNKEKIKVIREMVIVDEGHDPVFYYICRCGKGYASKDVAEECCKLIIPSPCNSCKCMTKTINGKCGKCKKKDKED